MKKIISLIVCLFSFCTLTNGQSFLDFAKENQTKEVINLLKDSHTNINQVDSSGKSALAYSVLNNNFPLIKKLLKAKAVIDPSAVIASAKMNNKKVFKLFNKAGFDINALDEQGKTPLIYAIEKNDSPLFDFLVTNKADISISDADGNTPFFVAIQSKKDIVFLEQLVSKKLDVFNSKNDKGESPLQFALQTKNIDLVKFLLKRGASIPETNNETNVSLLWFALEHNDFDFFKDLIKKGADIEEFKKNETPLLHAVKTNKKEWIELLLSLGANPMKDNSLGVSPILYRLARNELNEFNRLLEHSKAEINRPNRFGQTILDKAFQYSSIETIQSLINAGAEFGPSLKSTKTTPLMYAIEYGKDALIPSLIQANEINQENYYGNTPLILAIRKGDLNLVKTLVSKGANVNQKNYLGNSPIGYAVVNKQVNILHFLIQKGANVNIPNQYGSTPLIEAAYFNLPQMAIILIHAGADRNYREQFGLNAYDVANKQKNQAVLSVLSR